jgi:3-oxoacyl-[acyl-carrier protein] reductase
MLKAQFGRIINIASVVASTGNPGQANYAAAKAGLIGFSKSLAQEVATRHITVNVLAPGFIETDMTRQLNEAQRKFLLEKIPLKRLGQPIDVARACVYLASDWADYVTGLTLHVNGGMYMN